MAIRFILFLIINFGALGLGSFLMGDGPTGDWYQTLNKAPWTPPGWVFGTMWSLIMLCLSFYMAKAFEKPDVKRTILPIYIIQLILNISWNPSFFMFHKMTLGLVIILSLTFVVAYLLFNFKDKMAAYSFLLAPYLIWLTIATTLNAYALFMN